MSSSDEEPDAEFGEMLLGDNSPLWKDFRVTDVDTHAPIDEQLLRIFELRVGGRVRWHNYRFTFLNEKKHGHLFAMVMDLPSGYLCHSESDGITIGDEYPSDIVMLTKRESDKIETVVAFLTLSGTTGDADYEESNNMIELMCSQAKGAGAILQRIVVESFLDEGGETMIHLEAIDNSIGHNYYEVLGYEVSETYNPDISYETPTYFLRLDDRKTLTTFNTETLRRGRIFVERSAPRTHTPTVTTTGRQNRNMLACRVCSRVATHKCAGCDEGLYCGSVCQSFSFRRGKYCCL